MKNIFLAISAVSIMGLLGSCTKEPLNNITEDESRIYITNYDSSAVFNHYKTFSIVDSVSIINNNKLDKKALTDFDAAVIASIKSRMGNKDIRWLIKARTPIWVLM
ncbi:hypothetical protein [Paraflavitalea speifideaquila]|uniref:hypothetical protein n=1 Tax=Paraflavitalea speifideaquila TaxID=3076558 RepID=UPI0028EA6FD9|nr:hypothetical protein [Paraflavitalea speifideiaquila]